MPEPQHHTEETPLTLSPAQCRGYEQLAFSIVQDTASKYVGFMGSDLQQRSVNMRKWKQIKHHENVRVYRSRDKFHPTEYESAMSGLTMPSNDSAPPQKPRPWLLCIGSIPGSLDDAMYGAVTPTELSMYMRSIYLQDEFTAHRVLCDIDTPTLDDPFQYLGIKWAARASTITKLFKPRDMMYLEASGFHFMNINGTQERVGYVVYHSVDLPIHDLPRTEGMVRARISLCVLYREVVPGVVDVFATLMSNPGGKLPSKLAELSATHALMVTTKVTASGLNKKLVWLLNNKSSWSPMGSKSLDSQWTCIHRGGEGSAFSSPVACEVCHNVVCSKCVRVHKLALWQAATSRLVATSVAVCNGCVLRAKRLSFVSRIAAEEYVQPRERTEEILSRRRGESDVTMSTRSAIIDLVLLEEDRTPANLVEEADFVHETSLVDESFLDLVPEPSVNGDEDEDEDFEQDPEDEYLEDDGDDDGVYEEIFTHSSSPRLEPLPSPAEDEKLKLFMQMNQLRLQVERTYQMTMQTSFSHQNSK